MYMYIYSVLPEVRIKAYWEGGARYYIKAFASAPFLHQRKINTECILGQSISWGEHWYNYVYSYPMDKLMARQRTMVTLMLASCSFKYHTYQLFQDRYCVIMVLRTCSYWLTSILMKNWASWLVSVVSFGTPGVPLLRKLMKWPGFSTDMKQT